MCGIYGSTIKYSQELTEAKLERIKFRGPDYSEVKFIDDLVLGHNRLAIIDLDKRSNQPFSYLHLIIVFNGEPAFHTARHFFHIIFIPFQ